MSTMIGKTISHYRITGQLGSGGMGVVYKAEDINLGRTVALKFLAAHFLDSEEHKQRFLREAKAAASLDHPNICLIHEVGEADGQVFLAMGYVDGPEVRARIKERPLKLDEALDIAIQAGEGLRAAHEKGIVHRDIKSSNLMLTSSGQVKVMDFGLAQLTGGSRLTKTDTALGTPAYMSPEQAQRLPTDQRTDIWSLGVVLYEMVTGRLPFVGEREAAVLLSIISEPHEPITAQRAGVPLELDRIIAKALAKKPEQRYQHVDDLLVDLRALQGNQRSGSSGARPRKKMVWGLLGAASLLAAATVVFMQNWSAGPLQPDRVEYTQLTNFADAATSPALSPDGRMLTFIRGSSSFYGAGQVYVKILPEGEPKPLTRDSSSKMSPVFSADGSRIAYTTVDDRNEWDTWEVPVLGGEPRRWLPNASGLVWVTRKELLFSEKIRNSKGNHMKIVAAEESRAGARDVYVPMPRGAMAHRSHPSPDGKWVLVTEMDDRGRWLPCRLVPMNGTTSGRPVGPPGAACWFAAWTPDMKWMYFNSGAKERFHIWRQLFSEGETLKEPEQVTVGPTEEEGIAMSPDGRSFITSVGMNQSSVLLRDSNGERQISLEGFAGMPKFTPDGKRLLYLVRKSASSESGELWISELDSRSTEPLLPGFATDHSQRRSFDVSRDGLQLVMQSRDHQGKSRLWLAPLDRRSPPRQIPKVEGDAPMFTPDGEILFRGREGDYGFAFRVREDGTGLRKAFDYAVTGLTGLSPDGAWLIVYARPSHHEAGATMALPLRGGSPVQVFGSMSILQWSRDGRRLFLSLDTSAYSGVGGRTYVLPLPPGRALPEIPAGGFPSEEAIARFPGVRVIDSPDVAPGQAPDVTAFSRVTVHRNLYRVPVR